jgi:hypothetical protein
MSYIPDALRKQVMQRAEYHCEYCLIRQAVCYYSHEVDHIIPVKHRGKTDLDNLCCSCMECNRNKGSDFASFDPLTDEVTLLFNPRTDTWTDHFRLNGVEIVPLSPKGRVTVFVLSLNDEKRLIERTVLLARKRYP